MAIRTKNDPYLDAGMRGYIIKTAEKNWKKIVGCSFDDLVQEGWLVYAKCYMRYVGREPTPGHTALPLIDPDKLQRSHFMSIVQTAFHNHICSLAAKYKGYSEILACDAVRPDQYEEQFWESVLPLAPEEATAFTLLQSAPSEIKQLFSLLINDALELGSYRRFGKKRRSPRETNNQYYCRLLNLSPDYDIVGKLEEHFLTG